MQTTLNTALTHTYNGTNTKHYEYESIRRKGRPFTTIYDHTSFNVFMPHRSILVSSAIAKTKIVCRPKSG